MPVPVSLAAHFVQVAERLKENGHHRNLYREHDCHYSHEQDESNSEHGNPEMSLCRASHHAATQTRVKLLRVRVQCPLKCQTRAHRPKVDDWCLIEQGC